MRTILNLFLGTFRSLVLLAGGGIIAAILVFNGWDIFQHREMVELRLEDYIQSDPRPKWVKLTDCQLSLTDSYFETDRAFGLPDVAYIPLRPPNTGGPITVVLQSEGHVKLVQEIAAVETDPEALAKLTEEHKDEFQAIVDCSGWAESSALIHHKFQAMNIHTRSDLVVVNERFIPNNWGGLAFILSLCGLAMLIGFLGLWASLGADAPKSVTPSR